MAEAIYLSPTVVRFGAGKFNSGYYYLRAGSSGSDFPMPAGKTLHLQVTGNWNYFRFDNSRYTHEHRGNDTAISYGTTMSSSGFSASVTLVTTI